MISSLSLIYVAYFIIVTIVYKENLKNKKYPVLYILKMSVLVFGYIVRILYKKILNSAIVYDLPKN